MKKIFLSILAVVAVSILFTGKANAQQTQTDSLIQVVSALQSDHDNTKTSMDVLKRLTVSGYIQAQWQLADTAGINSYSGGNFPKNADNRFMVRRGRVKFAYTNNFSQFVLQIDATEKGVTLKDAYITVLDPWAQFVTLKAGVFDRPFGHEISYSSRLRETPERSRSYQILFPGERDLGAMISFQPKKGTRYDFIRLDLGIISGNGINTGFDNHKDFISHLFMTKANAAQTFKYGLGVSYYNGSVLQSTKYVYDMGELSGGVPVFAVDSASGNKDGYSKRQYLGVDGQTSFDSRLGITTIRAEYLYGNQPASYTTSTSPHSSIAQILPVYRRNYQGGYVYLVQNVGKSKLQLVAKYDWYDPNTKVSGDQITLKTSTGVKTNLGPSDIKFTTLGVGGNYFFNSNVKFCIYYEFVKNETTLISGPNSTNNYTKDLKDNVLTVRIQYSF
jgi:hypothetical protein